MLVISFAVALAYHMVLSQAAWGRVLTNGWYAVAAWPWFLVLAIGGALAWPGRIAGVVIPALISATFIAAEAIGLFAQMVPTYTGTPLGLEALRRLASLQPWFFGTAMLVGSALAAFTILAAVGWTLLTAVRRARIVNA
ncbi:MAG: hypothetical protein HYR85_10525 [Planctomycetes bacterium]|nr:hypothetical protein [Planctomycetota bacterium]MBI3845096.1 hypothetical protein [Planctomycetota bacterium]